MWSHRASAGSAEFTDLVHYAILAANSHNAQPWHFQQKPVGVVIAPDFSRSLPVVDADKLEIAPIRRQLGVLLGVGDRRVDLMVRYGHAAPMPRSLRRPVSDVIIAA